MKTSNEIGRRIRELRGDTSLRDFAKKCDVSHTTIDNLEKGIDFRTGKPTQVKIATLTKIAGACDVPMTYLIGDQPYGAAVATESVNIPPVAVMSNGAEVAVLRTSESKTALYKRLTELCKKKGIKGAKLCTDLGISKSLMTDLKSGRKKTVNAETAQKIASYFGVSVEYLLGEDVSPNKTIIVDNSFSENKQKLIDLARSVSEEKVESVLRLMKSILDEL